MEAKKPKKDDLPATLGFEPALAELEALVQKMEQGEMGLDVMVNAFERGRAAAFDPHRDRVRG